MLTAPEGFTQVPPLDGSERWTIKCDECGSAMSSYSSDATAEVIAKAQKHDFEHLRAAALRGSR